MALWQKLWLLFAVVWTVVAGLNVVTIVAFAEGELERAKWVWPALFGVAVPALVYALAWLWNRWRGGKRPGD